MAMGRAEDRSRSPRTRTKETLETTKDAVKADKVELTEADLYDGHSAKDLFESKDNRVGYTYDDLIVLPGHINFGIHDVDLSAYVTKKIQLKTPVVSSPMDTVTEAKMAICMALQGGMGVIHSNLPVDEQVQEVSKVKKFESGFIVDPFCVKPTVTLLELDRLRHKCGFTGFAVTDTGVSGSKLLGLVTKRDTDFITDRANTFVSSVMTKIVNLTVAHEGVTLPEANKMLRVSKSGKLPIVSKGGHLIAMVARTDLKKQQNFHWRQRMQMDVLWLLPLSAQDRPIGIA